MPKVSVMMPVHNMAGTVRQSVISVLENGFNDFELIIHLDGCTDSTIRRIDNLGDPRIKLVKTEVWGEHGGKARQVCLEASRGEYVCSFDADDVMLPGALQRQVDFLDANPAYVMTHCPVMLCDADMRPLDIFEMGVPGYICRRHSRWWTNDHNNFFPDVSEQVPSEMFEMEWEYSFMQTSACLMRGEVARRIGFDLNLPYRGSMQDYDLSLGMCKAGPVKWINQVTTMVRKRPKLSDKKWALPDVPAGPLNDRNRAYIQAKHAPSLKRKTVAVPYFQTTKGKVLSYQNDGMAPVFWPGMETYGYSPNTNVKDCGFDVVYSSHYLEDSHSYMMVRNHIRDCYDSLREEGLLKLIVPAGMVWVWTACEEMGFDITEEQDTDFNGGSYELFAIKRPRKILRKISVLMPVFNSKQTVIRAVESVLTQKLPFGWEPQVVIFDDGSTDGTREMLKSAYLDRLWVKIVTSDVNLRHIAKARNKALCEADGIYICTLDSDDEMLPGALARQIEFLESEEGQDFGFCHTPCKVIEYPARTSFYLLSMPASAAKGVEAWCEGGDGCLTPDVSYRVPEHLFDANLEYSFINNWGCVIRRSLAIMAGGYDETLPHTGAGEDYDFNLAISREAKGKWINKLSIVFHKDVGHSADRWNRDAEGNPLAGFFNYKHIQDKWRGIVMEKQKVEEGPKREKLALDVGAGDKFISIDGHRVHRLDSRPSTGADYICSADDLSLIKDDTYDYVYSSHVLEHFERPKAPTCLREWVRVLKVGGVLKVLVPDFTRHWKRVLSGDYNEHDTWCVLYGAHTNDYDGHHAFFTESMLRRLCEQQNLDIIGVSTTDENNGSIEVLARKKVGCTDEELMQSCTKAVIENPQITPGDKQVKIYTEWDLNFDGAELWFRFHDLNGLHHFSWVCTLKSNCYTTSLHLTPDILNVEGEWRASVYCNGLLVRDVPFTISKQTLVDRLLEDYK